MNPNMEMSKEKHYLSQEKCNELIGELSNLKTIRRKEIADRLEFAKYLGDLSEIIIEHHSGNVEVGSKVVVRKVGEKTESELLIVGPEEVDPVVGKISYLSPLGTKLLGNKAGVKISVTTPKGQIAYEIVKIK